VDIVDKNVMLFDEKVVPFSQKRTPQHTPKGTFGPQISQIFSAPRFARRNASPALGRKRDNQTRPNLWGQTAKNSKILGFFQKLRKFPISRKEPFFGVFCSIVLWEVSPQTHTTTLI